MIELGFFAQAAASAAPNVWAPALAIGIGAIGPGIGVCCYQIGDEVIDGSVAGRLAALRRDLAG